MVDSLPSQKVNAKKVKVLCTMSSKDQIPQPLLASSGSQKNIQMIKALQQLNQQMIQNSLQSSQSMSALSLLSPNGTTQAFNNLKGSTLSQHNFKHSNLQLSQHQPQHFSQQQLSLMKSQKQNMSSQNQTLSTKGSANVTASQIKIAKQKQTVKLQRCESHQSIISGSTPMNKQLQPKIGGNSSSLSPQQLKGQKTAKHARQSSTILNFHQAHQISSHQKSLSPQQLSLSKPRLFSSKMANDRVKSLETDDNISRALSSGSYEHIPGEHNRMTQIIRISPNKQFIVHTCSTQQTSPKEILKQSAIKLSMKNSVQTKKNQNLIYEQEDYLPPSGKNQRQDLSGAVNEYSLNKDYQSTVNHDYQMTRQNQHIKQLKESEESINQGFITDRQQSSKNEKYENHTGDSNDNNQKRTKGSSYTRNAQELKKLLLETGVIGGACLTTSLATAAAVGLLNNQEMPNPTKTELPKTTQKTSTHGKVKKNEIFCFSARGKSNKPIAESKRESTNGKQTCLLESNFNIKKQQNHQQKHQLESSNQTNQPSANVFYQTLDQNINIPTFPQSTTNQIKLKEFILKDDSEREIYQQHIDAPFQQLDNVLQAQLSRRSPSSCLSMKEDSTNFPLYETDQFIVRKDKARNYNQSMVGNNQIHDSQQQRILQRCWTAHDDIDRVHSNKENMCTECDDSSISALQNLNSDKIKFSDGKNQSTVKSLITQKSSQKRQSGISVGSKNTCFEYAKGYSPRTQTTEQKPIGKEDMNMKELEIIKFKMIAFVKTYENEFRKMKLEMNEIKNENKMLKAKLSSFQKRKSSNSISTNQNSQHASIVKAPNQIQFTQNNHMVM